MLCIIISFKASSPATDIIIFLPYFFHVNFVHALIIVMLIVPVLCLHNCHQHNFLHLSSDVMQFKFEFCSIPDIFNKLEICYDSSFASNSDLWFYVAFNCTVSKPLT